MVILVRAVQTCPACPSQWDAWDSTGQYWYLRYRFAHGTAEKQPGPDTSTWTGKQPEISFDTFRDEYDGEISFAEFCGMADIIFKPERIPDT